jgi:hypothetical protein
MDFILKAGAILTLIILVCAQVALISPVGDRLYTDNLNGAPIKSFQTTIRSGKVTLGSLGDYPANSASILINGSHLKTIDHFPVTITLQEGDVLEIQLKKGIPSFYVFLAETSGDISTDMTVSTVSISPGINPIFRTVAYD